MNYGSSLLRSCALLTTLCSAYLPANAGGVTLEGWIGARHLTYRAVAVSNSTSFAVMPRDAAYVAITEVYPDVPKPVCYHYLVSGSGIATYERRYAASGFGPVTYYLRVERRPMGRVVVRNLGGAPYISAVRGVTAAAIEATRRADRFTLMGTVINPHAGMSDEAQAEGIARRMPTGPERGIGRAFSREILYASADRDGVRRQIETARGWAKQHGMQALLGLVSWWNGTPRKVPDGLGGAFDDLKY
jgi:hypothetical protein